MIAILTPFFTAHLRHFRAGRIAVMARAYTQPVILERQGDYFELRRRRHVRRALAEHRDALGDDAPDLRIRVTDERFPRPHHATVVADWYCRGASGRDQSRLKARYYLRRHYGEICIEMIAFCTWNDDALPDAYTAQAIPAHAPTPRAGYTPIR